MRKSRSKQLLNEIERLLLAISVMLIQVFHSHEANGQAQIEFNYTTNGLEDDAFNVIQNAPHLDDFFEKLYQLKATGKGKINIIHLGDSHIQADFLTDVVRRNFQHDFGNAGRGLIVPGRVAGTNEPSNIRTSSTVPWIAKRCVYPNQPMPVGIGGITITTTEPGARLNIRMNDPIYDYGFNSVMLFFQKDSRSFNFSIRDTTDQELGFVGPYTDEPFVNYAAVTLPRRLDQIYIQTFKSSEDQKQATLFGIELENGNPGILYHAIGVNGAKYLHYNKAIYFARQTQALLPDVFIISLGTNESINYPYIDKSFYDQVSKLVGSLREFNPSAKFILVTPADAFRKRVKNNPGIELIREQLIRYAVDNGLAFWDMYKALGGKNSAQAWRNDELMRPDGVHFSKEGYQYQGNLLYSAIIKSYNQYVSFRHP